ncbi:MAG: helix-turn-helix domain-containing protein [Methylocella sp.]
MIAEVWLAEGIRDNADGLAGLADRPRPLRRPRLAEVQRSEVARRVEDGPDLKTDGAVRWGCADLRDRIAAKFNIHRHRRSVGKLLKKLNFSSISVRPVHSQSGLEAQEAFKNAWPAPSASGLIESAE